ncbi:hypothetical protein GGR50DRAFT_686108 [Xylaria sp. CBS 124048]|nr:hypothetical protein GGR50DRAFT_686108 [Xylaria sp. CBS 124048]
MATIEPRLIHLLNESTTTPKPHNAGLPPIKVLPPPQASSRPHPIEPGAGQRPDLLDANPAPQSIPSLYSIADDTLLGSSSRKDVLAYNTVDRSFPAHLLSQDLRMIIEDTPTEVAEDVSTKKRPVKEDFPQLPQPLKKQKAATHLFPPIIVGLLEPPSNASLFPPISSASFQNRPRSEPPQALNLSKPPEIAHGFAEEPAIPSPTADIERTPTGKLKRRAAKPRRKWSEEETNHLLLGVDKHGVGKWTDILEDPGYRFNDRTAGDLKDRFRTCCPEELRSSAAVKGDGREPLPLPKKDKRPKKGLMSENILNDTEDETEFDKVSPGRNDSEMAPKQRKSRAHRKRLQDLAELGIRGPFKKSQRRERRPFSEQDDQEILRGFEQYGPHWTKIQRDPRFHLSSRQPTDLRDRLRNKYPDKFVSTERTAMQVRDTGGRGNGLLEPSVNMDIENSLNISKTSLLEPQLNRTGSREDIPKWPLLNGPMEGEQMQNQPSLFWGEGSTSAFPSGEMDISRLLLDDTQTLSEPLPPDRRGFG